MTSGHSGFAAMAQPMYHLYVCAGCVCLCISAQGMRAATVALGKAFVFF